MKAFCRHLHASKFVYDVLRYKFKQTNRSMDLNLPELILTLSI